MDEKPGGFKNEEFRKTLEAEMNPQKRIDAAYAEAFRGAVNPYTGKPITAEADYIEYRRAYEEERRRIEVEEKSISKDIAMEDHTPNDSHEDNEISEEEYNRIHEITSSMITTEAYEPKIPLSERICSLYIVFVCGFFLIVGMTQISYPLSAILQNVFHLSIDNSVFAWILYILTASVITAYFSLQKQSEADAQRQRDAERKDAVHLKHIIEDAIYNRSLYPLIKECDPDYLKYVKDNSPYWAHTRKAESDNPPQGTN